MNLIFIRKKCRFALIFKEYKYIDLLLFCVFSLIILYILFKKEILVKKNTYEV